MCTAVSLAATGIEADIALLRPSCALNAEGSGSLGLVIHARELRLAEVHGGSWASSRFNLELVGVQQPSSPSRDPTGAWLSYCQRDPFLIRPLVWLFGTSDQEP